MSNEFEDSDDEFEGAAESLTVVIAAGTRVPDPQLLELYGLYKQGRVGPCAVPKPSFLDFKGGAKWKAWKALGDLPKPEARKRYVTLVHSVLGGEGPGDAEQAGPTSSQAGSRSGGGAGAPVVSLPTDAIELPDGEEDDGGPLHAAAAVGRAAELLELLKADPDVVDGRDSEGCTALHLAADAGHLEAVSLLMQYGASVQVTDVDGLTPLHYAALANRKQVWDALIRHGADAGMQDSQGQSAADVAPPGWTQAEQEA